MCQELALCIERGRSGKGYHLTLLQLTCYMLCTYKGKCGQLPAIFGKLVECFIKEKISKQKAILLKKQQPIQYVFSKQKSRLNNIFERINEHIHDRTQQILYTKSFKKTKSLNKFSMGLKDRCSQELTIICLTRGKQHLRTSRQFSLF